MEIPGPDHKAACLRRLEHAVQRLALDAAQQVVQFPDFAVAADELALDFDHWLNVCASNDYLERDLLVRLRELDEHLEVMSGGENAHLWTVGALESHAVWQLVRKLARDALEAAGWPRGVPPSPEDEGDRFTRAGRAGPPSGPSG